MPDTILQCQECNKDFTTRITDQVYGNYFMGRGKFCSAQCYTVDRVRVNKDNAAKKHNYSVMVCKEVSRGAITTDRVDFKQRADSMKEIIYDLYHQPRNWDNVYKIGIKQIKG